MSPLLKEVIHRWEQMFATLHSGGDISPSERLRTEGLMEALVISGEMTRDALMSAMDDSYRAVTGSGFDHQFGEDWRLFFRFPQIPAMGRRAPVYPSTKV